MRTEGVKGAIGKPLVASAGAIPPATRKIKKHGSAVRRGVGGDRRHSSVFIAPDSPPQRRNLLQQKRPASGKQIVSHTGRSRPSGATICEWSNVRLGALLRERKVTGRDASLPAPLLSAFGILVARGTVRALPQTPQGTLSLDPFSRLSWSLFLASSACLSSFILLSLT